MALSTKPTTEQMTHNDVILRAYLENMQGTVDLVSMRQGAYSSQFTSLEDWAADPSDNKILEAGTYTLDSTLHIKAKSLLISGDVTFNPSSPMVGVRMGRDDRTLLTTLTSSVVKGQAQMTLSGVSPGDTICFWNPTDGSWSGFRPNHRQGEFCNITKVVGGVAYFDSGVIDTYPAGTRVYKILFDKITLVSLGTININYQTYSGASIGWEFVQVKGFISGLDVRSFESPINLHFKRCMNLSGSGIVGIQSCTATNNTDYGIIFSNVQGVAMDVKACAGRHGVTVGGNGEECSIVNRFGHVYAEARTTGQGGVGAMDLHGNVEFWTYGGYAQGLVIGGNNNDYSGTFVDGIPTKPDFPSVLASELKGLNHNLSNMVIKCYGNPGTIHRGAIDLAGNSQEIGPLTTEIGCIDLSNTQLICPSALYGLNLRDWECAVNYNVNLNGFSVRGSSGNTAVRISPGSGSHMPTFIMMAGEGIHAGMNINIASGVGKYSGLMMSGIATVNIPAGVPSNSLTVPFNRTMPVGARVSVSRVSSSPISGAGASKMSVLATNITQTGFDIQLFTSDWANTVNARSEQVVWQVTW